MRSAVATMPMVALAWPAAKLTVYVPNPLPRAVPPTETVAMSSLVVPPVPPSTAKVTVDAEDRLPLRVTWNVNTPAVANELPSGTEGTVALDSATYVGNICASV